MSGAGMFRRQWQLSRWWSLRRHLLRWAFDPERISNLLQLGCSRLLRQRRLRGLPVILGIEPTNRCNLRCPMCHRTHHPRAREADLSFADYRRIIDEVGDSLLCLFLWNQGEPLLNPDLPRMVAYAKDKGILTMVSTNATLLGRAGAGLIDAGLDQLIVCLDGATAQSYSRYRPGADLSAVVDNVRGFIREKRRLRRAAPFVELQCLVMRDNEHEMDAVRALGRGLGVDRVCFRKIEMPEARLRAELFPRNREFLLGVYKEGGRPRPCFRPWYSALIEADGTVLACCHDFLARHALGNVRQRPFREVWESPAYQELRDKALRGGLSICAECPAANFDGDYAVS